MRPQSSSLRPVGRHERPLQLTLEDLGNLGEFIGALAVVASLVYLAAQIRQNTRVVLSATDQAQMDAHARYLGLLAQDPELTSLFLRGAACESLDENEAIRFSFLLHHIFTQVQAGFFHHRGGVISVEQWEAMHRVAGVWLSSPGARAWWNREKHLLRDEFVRYIDSAILSESAE